MNDQLQALLQAGAVKLTAFPPNSRYQRVGTTALKLADGRTVAYLQRRFVPPPEAFSLLQEHSVVQGDRLDNLAAAYFGDAELFWRICDANGAIRPDELTETIRRRLRITLPEGIPGAAHA